MEGAFEKIIKLAVTAPSGENAQPWQFKIQDNQIFLYNVPDRDQSAYNFNQYASYVAHGAAIENIEITSRALGHLPKTELFPATNDPNLVAIITLEQSTPQTAELYEFIEKRVTNRKPYKKEPLTKEQTQDLLNQKEGGAEFLITEDLKNIETLAEVGASNEYIMLQNKAIHNFFFNHINWNPEEEQKNRFGFYIKTLELPPPAQAMFKIFSKWWRMRIFKTLGFPKIVMKQNAQVYAQAGAMGIITIPNTMPTDFIHAGRLTQRIWLTATQHELSMQPMTGILFFMLRLNSGDTETFTQIEAEIIKKQYKKIQNIFNVQTKNIVMMFRIGVGDAPSAQSARYHIETFINNNS